jgi:hypothetical protein
VLALVCAPLIAGAQTPVVVSVRGPEAESAEAMRARVMHELETRGFVISTQDVDDAPPEGDPVEAVLVHARSAEAAIGVSIVLTPTGRTRIDVVAPTTGARAHRSIETGDAGHGPSTIALAAAELVEATWLEQHRVTSPAAGTPSPSQVEAPPNDERPPNDTQAPQVQADAAVGVLWPIQTKAPVAVAIVSIGLRPSSRIGISAEATVPFHALGREVELATLKTYPFLVGVRTDIDLLPRRSRVRLDAQAAVTALALRIEVDPSAGAHGHPQTIWTTAGTAGLHLHGAVGRRLRLGGALRLVVPFEDITLRAGEEAAQRLGPVWVGAAISIGARW